MYREIEVLCTVCSGMITGVYTFSGNNPFHQSLGMRLADLEDSHAHLQPSQKYVSATARAKNTQAFGI